MTKSDRDDLGRRQRRGFGLADVLILISSTAVALAWLRKPLEPRLAFLADGRIILNLRPMTIVGAAFAATWGVGVLAMRLRPQQRGENDWRARPGFVACAAATLVALIKLATLLIWGAFEDYRSEAWYVPSILGQLIEPVAMGVVGAWLALWLSGAWHREKTLIDDLGIAIGALWLVLNVAAWAALCI